MPRKTIHGIDLTAPGGLEALFAFRRAQFGDATMSVAPAEGAPAGPPAGAPAAVVAPVVTPATVAPVVAPPAAAAEKVEDLPDWAQKIIRDTRDEAAANRTGKTTVEQQLAALTKILNPEAAAGEAPDPAALATQLAAKDETIRTLTIDNALAASLTTNQASPLTASVLRGENAFKDLDPAAPDFQAKLDAVVKEAVTKHPELKTVQAAGASGANFSGGSGESAKKETTLAGAVANHYRT